MDDIDEQSAVETHLQARGWGSWPFLFLTAALLLFGFLAFAVSSPILFRRCHAPMKNACIANLKQIEGAKRTWVTEFNVQSGAQPVDGALFGPTRYLRDRPNCPEKGFYIVGEIGEKASCSIPGHTI